MLDVREIDEVADWQIPVCTTSRSTRSRNDSKKSRADGTCRRHLRHEALGPDKAPRILARHRHRQ